MILKIQLPRTGMFDEYPIGSAPVTIGRAPDNDIILDDQRISRHHMQIHQEPSGIFVTDLGSANGVQVNGRPIPPRTPTPININDRINMGEFLLWVETGTATAAPAAARMQISAQAQPGLLVTVEGRPYRFPLTKQVVTIGRAPDNDILIDHPMISRKHAEIRQEPGGYVIYDPGSTNGLIYQGQRITRLPLMDGQTLAVGGGAKIEIQFRANIGMMPVEEKPREDMTLFRPQAAEEMGLLNLKGMDLLTIGRAPDNRVVLNHPQVSLHHAAIERVGGRYRILDYKSTAGVFVNGQRVEKEAWLHLNDEIRIASIRLILRETGIQRMAEEGLRLEAVGLNKWVSKKKNLLQNISLSILPQEFVALVGMSGSGKSTLLDAINGFRPATHGRVTINGIDLYQNFDMYRNEMGYVPQKDIVHQELTVFSALDYAAQLRMPPDTQAEERHKRIMEVLDDLDLTERKDLPIHKLSGGQLKRVSIGVELLTRPRLFFLDEPTSGLDPGTEAEMMRLLRRLADQGRTIILITHATKNVMMCDKVIFLARGGYLAYFGPPEEALGYFDQFRTPQERQQSDMEFDKIYAILSDEKRGKGEEWNKRYLASRHYQQYVLSRLQSSQPVQAAPAQLAPQAVQARRTRPQTGTLRQFLILSARNLQIMRQDKIGLALMLALAPLIGLMDFMWGSKLFDIAEGNPTTIITTMFMEGLISILVGAMASVREIVKEVDIYKRERAINLRLPSYILSKVMVGLVLSLYQAVVLVLFLYFFVLRTSPLTTVDYGLMLITMLLGTLSGYMFGLMISAAAPNQNVALLAVIVVLVPQFLFSGALLPLDLIPGGEAISSAISTRWAFESLVNITGIGKDIVADKCWQYAIENDKKPSDLTLEQKEQWNCNCMGVKLFTACNFPGIRDPEVYTDAAKNSLAIPAPVEPVKPTAYPTFTSMPSLTPLPSPTPPRTPTPRPSLTPIPSPANPALMQTYMAQRETQGKVYENTRQAQGKQYENTRVAQGDDYQNTRIAQGKTYEDLRIAQGKDYEKLRVDQGDQYADAMKKYGDLREDWQREREKALSSAENKMQSIVENYGQCFEGNVYSRWTTMLIIILVVFGLVVFFQKRKDTI